MMDFVDSMYLGMHGLWWLFWIAVAVVLVATFVTVPRRREPESRIEELFRRYRGGDISEAEFDREMEALKSQARPRK
jgi:putative membrane protein